LGLRHLSPLSTAIIDKSEVLPQPGSDWITGVSDEPIKGIIVRNSLIDTVLMKLILAMIIFPC